MVCDDGNKIQAHKVILKAPGEMEQDLNIQLNNFNRNIRKQIL